MKNTTPITLSRREALAFMGALTLSTQLGWAVPENKPGMAIQLYTLRDPAKKDLAGTLKKVREMGWEYVQWSGMPELSAAEIRAALDTAGLKAIACHCSVEQFETDFDKNAQFWKSVGVTYAGPGGMMNDCKDSFTGWLQGAKRLNALGAKMREQGLLLAYHNHAFEFEKFPEDPRAKEDILFDETSADTLLLELDIAWINIAGVDPAAYIRKCKGRCQAIHAKDHEPVKDPKKQPRFTALGRGCLKWDDILAAGKDAGVQWYIYEQDNGRGDPFEYAAESYKFLAEKL